MSRHLQFYLAGLVLVGGLSSTPACSDPFTDLFNIAPRELATTSSLQPERLPRAGSSPGHANTGSIGGTATANAGS
jgi:hypothetical protein